MCVRITFGAGENTMEPRDALRLSKRNPRTRWKSLSEVKEEAEADVDERRSRREARLVRIL